MDWLSKDMKNEMVGDRRRRANYMEFPAMGTIVIGLSIKENIIRLRHEGCGC